MSLELHGLRVDRERRWSRVRAAVIDGALVLYGAWLVLYLLVRAGAIAEGPGEDWLYEPARLAAMALAALVLGALWSLVPSSVGRVVVERTTPLLKSTAREFEGGWLRTPSGAGALVLTGLTVVVGWMITRASLRDLLSAEGLRGAQRIFAALLTPNWGILRLVIEKMVETLFIAFVATLIAVPVAFVASFPSARNLVRGSKPGLAAYTLLRFLFNFTRSVEPLVWAIIFSVWVGIGPFAGMLALMLHSVAALGKLYSEQIENVDRGPIEAIEATGANRVQVVWFAVVPQVVLPYLSFTIYRWDINVRMATIIGFVGGGGIGVPLVQAQGLARWHDVGTIVIVIAAVVWALDYLSARLREAIY